MPDQLRSVPAKALLYMFLAIALLCILDAGVKQLAAAYPIPQIVFLRYTLGLVLAVFLAGRLGGMTTLKTRRLRGHMLRSVLNLATMLLFYFALRELPLADVVAINFAAPLFMTALSVPLLREKVGPRRWTAVMVGLAGVLVMVRPSGAGLDLGAMLALSAAVLYALMTITSRQLSTTESSHTILFYYSIGVLIATGAVLPWQWETPAWGDVWIFVLVGVTGSFGQWFLNQALRYGEVSLLAPIEYTALLWATLLGLVFFEEVPSWTVLAGAAVVIACNLYIVQSETRRA